MAGNENQGVIPLLFNGCMIPRLVPHILGIFEIINRVVKLMEELGYAIFRCNDKENTFIGKLKGGIRFVIKAYVRQIPRISLGLLLLFTIPAFSIRANAKAPGETESTNTNNFVYPASFFAQYAPQNALEMIEHLPGFNFDQGSNARGFGGNAGNVLIDGERPTSKSGGLRAALVRIPAAQVERIEILRGGNSSGEAAGQSIVASVTLKKTGSSGSWAFKERWTRKGKLKPNLEAAIVTKLGNWNSSFDIDIGAASGYRTADIETTDADGQLVSGADERFNELTEFLFINGEGALKVGKGNLTLNSRIGGNRYYEDTERDIFNGRLPVRNTRDQFWRLGITTKYEMAEFGIDWNQTVEDWKWKVIGLGLVEDNQFENKYHFQTVASGDFSDSNFAQDARNTEYIGRTTFSKVAGSAFKPEFGFEWTKNKLSSGSTFFENGVQQELNGGDVEVEELRGEVFSTFVYAASEKLTLEGGLTAEVSKIEISGETGQEQSFKFIKPRISATYKFNTKSQLAFELDRWVGQLNFNDFAASSQASDDRTTSGNPDLAPDQAIELAMTYDWSLSTRGSLKIKAFHQWKDDILEQILLSSGGQGIGNAGDARFWGIKTDLSFPLDFVLKEGLIEISYVYHDSNFDDPITNNTRTINGYTPNWLTFKLRQDITRHQVAWGLEFWGRFTDTSFFVDERQTFSGNRRLRFFIETSHFFGVKMQLDITNANTANFDRTRFTYEDDRGGAFKGIEIARRIRRPEFKLTFSRNF